MRRIVVEVLLATGCVVGLVSACFGQALVDDRQLAYRDFSDFYYPLYQRVQQEWQAGRWPLWSAEENGGSPMLGNPTSAVLYPGKLIYAMLPYPRAAKAYVVAHVLLAFGSMVVLLRGCAVSRVGATLGGLAYAFGAPVLTQYSNVVFLVGAAWMPLGFRFADDWIRRRSPRALAGLAFVLAMQVLGGDPEAAYLTALAAGAYAVGQSLAGEPEGRLKRMILTGLLLSLAYVGLVGLEVLGLPDTGERTIAKDSGRPWWILSTSTASLIGWFVAGLVVLIRWRGRGRGRVEGTLLGLLGACVLGAAMTGAQLLPTIEFIGQSTRVEGSPHFDIYAHSIHPACLVEWAWPGAFGSTTHRDRKWLAALPPTQDHRIWMSSVYLGGLTLQLAVGAAGFRRGGSAARGWFTGVVLVGVLGGFGSFGSPLFWIRATTGTEARLGVLEVPEPELPRADGRLRDGDGGVYWFLASTLPGFRSFRYPGKLFVPAALGMAALAGLGFDDLVAGRRRRALIVTWIGLVAGLVGLGLSIARGGPFLAYLIGRAEASTSVFGPFDARGALVDLRSAMIHGTGVGVAYLVLARVASRRPGIAGGLALVVMAVDLGVANRGEVGVVAQSAYDAESPVLAAIRRDEKDQDGPGRIFRLHSWVPGAWRRSSSLERLEEIVRWERQTLRPKYEQPLRIASTFAYGTTELADYGAFFEPFSVQPAPAIARGLGLSTEARVNYFPRRGFDLWNTRYFILPTRLSWGSRGRGFGAFLADSRAIYPPPLIGPDARARGDRRGMEEDVQVLRNLNAYPRAWVVHRAIPVGPPSRLTMSDRRRLMTGLLYQDDELWQVEGREVADPRRVAWVEDAAEEVAGLRGGSDRSEPVEVILGDDPTRVEIWATLKSPGLVVLADVHYPGWRLEVDGRPTRILRVNRAMRGAVVPAGEHRLVYTYRPTSMSVGVALSAMGLLGWVGLLAMGKLPGQDSNLERQDQNLS